MLLNEWFASLEKGRRDVLVEDKWMLANACWDGAVESLIAEINILALNDSAIQSLIKIAETQICINNKNESLVNDWFLKLDKGRQAALLQDKWTLANSAWCKVLYEVEYLWKKEPNINITTLAHCLTKLQLKLR
jgi:hypothetical protein